MPIIQVIVSLGSIWPLSDQDGIDGIVSIRFCEDRCSLGCTHGL